MSAITELQSAWQARTALISDPVIKAEANYLLENYVAATQKQAALEANTITSYSIGGRSVTRRDTAAGQTLIQQMRMELYRLCYGGTSLLDLNTE